MNGEMPKVQECKTEPAGIIWENVHETWKTRWLRWVIQLAVVCSIIVGSFVVISILNIVSSENNTNVDTSSFTWSTIQTETNTTIVESWCLK